MNCNICGEEFEDDRKLLRHVKACYRKHEDELHEELEERSKPMWDHDEERYDWLRSGRNP